MQNMIPRFGRSVSYLLLIINQMILFFSYAAFTSLCFSSLDQAFLSSENIANFANAAYTKEGHLTIVGASLMVLSGHVHRVEIQRYFIMGIYVFMESFFTQIPKIIYRSSN